VSGGFVIQKCAFNSKKTLKMQKNSMNAEKFQKYRKFLIDSSSVFIVPVFYAEKFRKSRKIQFMQKNSENTEYS
jgi:hypothetical protein